MACSRLELEPGSPAAVCVILEDEKENQSNDKEEDGHNSWSHWNTDQLGLQNRKLTHVISTTITTIILSSSLYSIYTDM